MIGPDQMVAAGLLLCGGSGSRFSSPTGKLLYPLGAMPVVSHALSSLLQAGFEHVIVVDGASDLSYVVGTEVVLVHNYDWEEGMATTLQRGIEAARTLGADSVVVGLGDQPGIPPEAWRIVAGSHERPIAVATYHGKRRNPVRLDKPIWDLLPVTGDEGARILYGAYPELVEEVDCPGDPQDIDTLEDLIKWNS